MSSYAFTLCAMTQVDGEDVAGWIDRARADLDAELERVGETDSVLRLVATVRDQRIRMTVYKGYGRVRLEYDGTDRSLVQYLADRLELSVIAEVVRTLPGPAARPETNGDARQEALMEMFRTLGNVGRR